MHPRYEIVRHASVGSTEPLQNTERHPDQPAIGFAWASEANLWAIAQHLDGDWFIRPIEPDAQPARLGGIA